MNSRIRIVTTYETQSRMFLIDNSLEFNVNMPNILKLFQINKTSLKLWHSVLVLHINFTNKYF